MCFHIKHMAQSYRNSTCITSSNQPPSLFQIACLVHYYQSHPCAPSIAIYSLLLNLSKCISVISLQRLLFTEGKWWDHQPSAYSLHNLVEVLPEIHPVLYLHCSNQETILSLVRHCLIFQFHVQGITLLPCNPKLLLKLKTRKLAKSLV